MNLASLPEISRQSTRRDRAWQLVTLMRRGTSTHLTVMDTDEKVFEVFDLLSANILRGAIAKVAEETAEDAEECLRKLGVTMPAKPAEPEPTVEALTEEVRKTRRELDMYRNAWLRSLGGKVRPKAHLIDALVVTTEDMREKADRYVAKPSIAKTEHDARVTELLEHNNTMEERMRKAQRDLKRFMDGTPAERLAFAVEQAAASTIAAIKQEKSHA